MWGENEHGTARKPAEQAQQLKGVFGEGASVLAVPEAARAANAQQAHEAQQDQLAQRQQLTPEQLQRRGQSRGLWTDGGDQPTAPSNAQARDGALPRAVVGTPSPKSPANTNYRNPSIGNADSQPAQDLPLAAAARAPSRELSEAYTTSVHPDFVDQSSIPPDGLDGDTMEIPVAQLRGKQLPEVARSVAPPAAAPAPTPARAQPPASAPNTGLWLALILIAAIVALLFIGAAAGLWSLPWKKSSIGKSSLNKAIAAKSLPEMHAVAPAAQVSPPSAALPVAAAPIATPAQPSAAVLEADEAAPLRAPTLSGANLDDALDPPNPEIAPTLAAARAELRAGKPKEAEALLRPLLDAHPDDQHLAEAMAQALLARGAAVEAVSFAQRIVKKRPKRASYKILLGDALRRAGDEPSAKLAYRDALALDPKLREAQRRLKNRAEPRKIVATQ